MFIPILFTPKYPPPPGTYYYMVVCIAFLLLGIYTLQVPNTVLIQKSIIQLVLTLELRFSFGGSVVKLDSQPPRSIFGPQICCHLTNQQ